MTDLVQYANGPRGWCLGAVLTTAKLEHEAMADTTIDGPAVPVNVDGRRTVTPERRRSGPKPLSLQERLLRRIKVDPETGCWLWQGGLLWNGYGRISVGSRKDGTIHDARAHRVAYEVFVGPVPDGLGVLHRCDVRRCLNPEHLFLGTNSDNMQDMKEKGTALKPACRRGHPRTPENTFIRQRGTRTERVCRICKRENAVKQFWREDNVAQRSRRSPALNTELATYIRQSPKMGKELASELGVARATISRVRTGKGWGPI